MTEHNGKTPLLSASAAWFAWLEIERGLLPSTIGGYRREMRMLWSRYPDRVLTLTTEDLRTHLVEAGGKASTVGGRIAAFRSFYGFLVLTDRRVDDPTVKLNRPRIHRGIPKPIENRALIFAMLSPAMRLVATILLETGLRISEACSLDVGVPAPAQIMVRGKGAKERLVLLTPKARAALDELGGTFPYRKRVIQRNLQLAGTHAHAFRHTLGCDLAASDADLGEIQEILGHSNPATTRGYAAYKTDRLWRAHERRSEAVA
jgi:integrase/recombinase XerD